MRLRWVFLWVALAQSPLFAADAGTKASVEEPAFEVVKTEQGGGPAGAADFVGRTHPALVHFPLAWLLGTLIIDAVGVALRREGWQRWGLYALSATAIAAVPTVATGLLRAGYMPKDPDVQHALGFHETLNLIVVGLVLVALALRLMRRNRLEGWARPTYLTLMLLATTLVMVAADFGGRMVYGADFLPW